MKTKPSSGYHTYRQPGCFDFDLACKYGLDVSVFVTELAREIQWNVMAKKWSQDSPPDVELVPTVVLGDLTYALLSWRSCKVFSHTGAINSFG